MGASIAGANRVLDATVAASDMWLGVALDADPTLTSVVEADATYLTIPRVLIPAGAAGWNPAAARAVTALATTDHGAILQDFTPQFIVWWSAAVGGTPLYSRRVLDTDPGRVGDPLSIPATTIQLVYPDPTTTA